jgi:class 3 adenylate cyclase
VTELPTGTVTFLFTDLEASTRLWEEHPDAMRAALARHDEILRDAVEKRDGVVVKTTGDGLHASFAVARDALGAAVDAQLVLGAEDWPLPEPLRVRMGLHTGAAEARAGDYFGPAVNRAARVSAAGHGGQILMSHATEELVRDDLPEGSGLIDLGEQRLRDLERPERVFQVTHVGLASEFAPVRSLDAYPTNLPAQRTSFVGREREVADVAAALTTARLVTLTGVGGVGKTRLALQVAAEVLPHRADGVWLCELAPVSEPEGVLDAVASAVGVASQERV